MTARNGGVANLPVADLDDDRIDDDRVDEDHWVDRIQRAGRAFRQFPGNLLRDAAVGVLGDRGPMAFSEVRGDLPGR
jgi:hypothetical protein